MIYSFVRSIPVLILTLWSSTLWAQETPVFHPSNGFPDPDKWYFIQQVGNGLAIGMPNVIPASGNNLHNTERLKLMLDNRSASITDYQQWRFLPTTAFAGYFRIINKGSNLVMEVPNSSLDTGVFIQQNKMTSQITKAQFFKLVFTCNNEFFLTPLVNGFCFSGDKEFSSAFNLNFPGILPVNGWFVRQYRLGTTELQRWKLTEAD